MSISTIHSSFITSSIFHCNSLFQTKSMENLVKWIRSLNNLEKCNWSSRRKHFFHKKNVSCVFKPAFVLYFHYSLSTKGTYSCLCKWEHFVQEKNNPLGHKVAFYSSFIFLKVYNVLYSWALLALASAAAEILCG